MTVATVRRTTVIDLHLTEENAQRLKALLVGSLNWARNGWAKGIYDALGDAAIEETDEQADAVRHEVERYIDTTQDVLVGPDMRYASRDADYEDDGL